MLKEVIFRLILQVKFSKVSVANTIQSIQQYQNVNRLNLSLMISRYFFFDPSLKKLR
jgi:hypothetical protein